MHSGIGDELRAARRARGCTLADAAQATHVRESYLAALEEEDFAALGSEVYARGFLRTYARFLGLDPEPLLEAHRASTAEPERRGRARPARTRRPAARGEPGQAPLERPAGTAILLLLVLIVLLVIAYIGLWGGEGEALGAPVAAGRGL